MTYNYCPFCARTLETRIEEERERRYCRECKWTYYPKPDIAVAAVITEVDKNSLEPCVLMVKRNREPFKNTWMFPAGFLESGEHPEEALTRELREETGLIVKSSRLIRISKSISDPRSPNHLVFFYHTQTDPGEIINNDTDENSDIQRKSIYSEIDIGFPHHKNILNEIKSRVSDYFDYGFKQ